MLLMYLVFRSSARGSSGLIMVRASDWYSEEKLVSNSKSLKSGS